MRKEANHWRPSVAGESAQASLARLLVALEELRVRLNPQIYPNLEISDEGHLWFNVPLALGAWEVFVLPEGLGDLPGPALALSFPHRPTDLKRDILEILTQSAPPNATVFLPHSTRCPKSWRPTRRTASPRCGCCEEGRRSSLDTTRWSFSPTVASVCR